VGALQVAMEYCDGGTLRHFRQKADIDEPEVAYICREVRDIDGPAAMTSRCDAGYHN
jgi:hypothetical protein